VLLTTSQYEQLVILRPEAEYLDAGNEGEFRQQVKTHMRPGSSVALDMSRIKFIDSSGLGALLSCLREANGSGVGMKLFSLTEPVAGTLRLVRLHRVFHILNNLEETLLALGTAKERLADALAATSR
jgi:anti-sigma B factor antagonist